MTAQKIIDYLGEGTAAAKPVAPDIPAGGIAIYFETDTGDTFLWDPNGAAWVQIAISDITNFARLDTSQSFTKGQATTPVALTPGANVSVDASLSNNFTLTADQNFQLDNPTNLKAGQKLNFWITQDGTGSRILTLDTQYQAPSGASSLVLSTAPGAKDLLSCVSDSTSSLTCTLVKAISH